MNINFDDYIDSGDEFDPAESYEPFGATKFPGKSPVNPASENWKSGHTNWKNLDYSEDSGEALGPARPGLGRDSNQTLPHANSSFSRGTVDNRQPSLASSNSSTSSHEQVPVAELPMQYRSIFQEFTFFNRVQSVVFNAVFRSDANLIVSAPTGSGKTTIFELAIVRLLMNANHNHNRKANFKIVYVAPLKALCSEKFHDWREKFEKKHGLICIEVTGDSDFEEDVEFAMLGQSNVIFTTPERLNFMSQKTSYRTLMSTVKLIIADEFHVIGEGSRGAMLEGAITRILALQRDRTRILAASATLVNIQELAEWIGAPNPFIFGEEFRPVTITKFVLGFSFKGLNMFAIDHKLNEVLPSVIDKYSPKSKPTLVFCSSRNGAEKAAAMLAIGRRPLTREAEQLSAIDKILDKKLRELVSLYSIGYHHAGLDQGDRAIVENLFLNSQLLVLMCTNTLAIGVNLPAHLVVIKLPMYYDTPKSCWQDYSALQIQQMIGRAGRPQFGMSAVVVILTTNQTLKKHTELIAGSIAMEAIESHLHTNLIEHINAEIVLGTITNLPSAIKWLKSTFLYIRLKKNPAFYGVLCDNSSGKRVDSAIDGYLTELCKKNLAELMSVSLIEKFDFSANPEAMLLSTDYGRLMANYCVLFNTMRFFISKLNHELATKNKSEEEEVELDELDLPKKSLRDLILLIANSQELEDIKLRTSDKAALNAANNNGKVPKKTEDMLALNKSPHLIRYRFEDRVKTNINKIDVLIQMELGSIPLTDASMVQDTFRIFRIGQRLTKCMLDYLVLCSNHEKSLRGNIKISSKTVMTAAALCQAFSTHLWHDSPHIFKQFPAIGSKHSQKLIDVGITKFEQVLDMSPGKLESIFGKHPPFGSTLIHAVRQLPKFKMHFQIVESDKATSSQHFDKSQDAESELNDKCSVVITCLVDNFEQVNFDSNESLVKSNDQIMLILGDSNDNLINVQRLTLGSFRNEGQWIKRIELNRLVNGCTIHVSMILLNFVGLDVHQSFDAFGHEEAENEIGSFFLHRSPSPLKIFKTPSKSAKTKSSASKSKPSKDDKSVVDTDTSASDHESESVKELDLELDEEDDVLTLEDATFSTESYGFDMRKAASRLNQFQSDSEDETDFGDVKSFKNSPQNVPKPKAIARNTRSKSPNFSEKKRTGSSSDFAYDDEPKTQEDYSVFSKLKKTKASPRQLKITDCLKRTQSKIGISSVAPNAKRIEATQPAPTPKPEPIVKANDFSQRVFKFKPRPIRSEPALEESDITIVQKKSKSPNTDPKAEISLGSYLSDEELAEQLSFQELPQTFRVLASLPEKSLNFTPVFRTDEPKANFIQEQESYFEENYEITPLVSDGMKRTYSKMDISSVAKLPTAKRVPTTSSHSTTRSQQEPNALKLLANQPSGQPDVSAPAVTAGPRVSSITLTKRQPQVVPMVDLTGSPEVTPSIQAPRKQSRWDRFEQPDPVEIVRPRTLSTISSASKAVPERRSRSLFPAVVGYSRYYKRTGWNDGTTPVPVANMHTANLVSADEQPDSFITGASKLQQKSNSSDNGQKRKRQEGAGLDCSSLLVQQQAVIYSLLEQINDITITMEVREVDRDSDQVLILVERPYLTSQEFEPICGACKNPDAKIHRPLQLGFTCLECKESEKSKDLSDEIEAPPEPQVFLMNENARGHTLDSPNQRKIILKDIQRLIKAAWDQGDKTRKLVFSAPDTIVYELSTVSEITQKKLNRNSRWIWHQARQLIHGYYNAQATQRRRIEVINMTSRGRELMGRILNRIVANNNATEEHGVYAIIERSLMTSAEAFGNACIYVGSTNCLPRRRGEHLKEASKAFDTPPEVRAKQADKRVNKICQIWAAERIPAFVVLSSHLSAKDALEIEHVVIEVLLRHQPRMLTNERCSYQRQLRWIDKINITDALVHQFWTSSQRDPKNTIQYMNREIFLS